MTYTVQLKRYRFGEEVTNDSELGTCAIRLGDPYSTPVDPHQPAVASDDWFHGIPHFGLVTRIEDQEGNRIDLDYCNVEQWIWADQSECGPIISCKMCSQNANEVGQLKAATLSHVDSDGARITDWTLLYTYREFGQPTSAVCFVDYGARYDQHALHSIHAYRGAMSIPAPCDALSSDNFCTSESAENAVSALSQVDALAHFDAPEGWSISAAYAYGEAFEPASDELCAIRSAVTNADGQSGARALDTDLLKVTVSTRPQSTSLTTNETRSVYKHVNAPSNIPIDGLQQLIGDVYGRQQVGNILGATAVDGEATSPIADANWIIGHDASAVVRATGISSTGPSDVTLKNLAALSLRWPTKPQLGVSELVNDKRFFCDQLLQAGLDPSEVMYRANRVTVLTDRRTGSPRTYATYGYAHVGATAGVSTPASESPFESTDNSAEVSLYHFPYRIPTAFWQDVPDSSLSFVSSVPGRSMWIAVVDEVAPDSVDAYLSAVSSRNLGGTATPIPSLLNRRIVEMNPAGLVLRDRTWRYSDGVATLSESNGLSEEIHRDVLGRVIERRTKGWSATQSTAAPDPNDADPESAGLIYVYEYADPRCEPGTGSGSCGSYSTERGEPYVREGIKKGTNGTVYYTRALEREPSSPWRVTREVRFAAPTTDPASGGEETHHYYVYAPGTTRVVQETVVGPPARQSGDSSAMLRPWQRTSMDSAGRVESIAAGSVYATAADLQNPAGTDFASLSFHRTGYDEYGRLSREVVDDPTLVSGLARMASTPPLNLITEYVNHWYYGRTDVIRPDGKEDRLRYVSTGGTDHLQQWVFSALSKVDPNGNRDSAYRTNVPIVKNEIQQGRVVSSTKFTTEHFDHFPDGLESSESLDVISTTTPQYDVAGNVTSAETNGTGAAVSAGNVSYSGFGQPARQQSPDGTVTRNEYDSTGRLVRVYRGTSDGDVHWGGAGSADNMSLVERRTYGSGVRTADRPTSMIEYRTKPRNQYFIPPDPTANPPIPPNNEDQLGSTTRVDYDWRMRPVVRTRIAEQTWPPTNPPTTPSPIRQEFSWLDHQGREVVNATLSGEWNLGAVDPRNLGPGAAVPSAAAILAAVPTGATIVSLTEQVLNGRGQVEESRRYAVRPGSPEFGQYTSAWTYYDFAGRVVESRSADSPIRRFEYDAAGRQIRSSSWAQVSGGSVEIERNETTFDSSGRQTVVKRLEREANATGSELSGANAVSSWRYQWFDENGRVAAVAEFGTNAPSYSNGVAPIAYAADLNPASYSNAGELTGCSAAGLQSSIALVTCYEYDAAGRQSAVWHPDGSLTRTEYDALGRTVLTIENRSAQAAADRRVTAYQYDSVGHLVQIAAVLPTHEGGVLKAGSVNWAATDGSLQVTRIYYGAAVVDARNLATTLYTDPSYVSAVDYPSATTGQPDSSIDLSFQYYSNGLVATRSDKRGVTFHYAYDELQRLEKIDVTGLSPVPGQPPMMIDHVEYEYDAAGRARLATAETRDANGAPLIVAQSWSDYDGYGNLSADYQAIGQPVSAQSRKIAYVWDFAGAASGNHNRLTAISYPYRTDGSYRTIQLGYGAAGSIDDALSRITQISDASNGAYTAYTYGGMNRRVSLALGNGIAQTFDSDGATPGYPGLDAFGRIADLNYVKTSTGETVHRYQYTYDAAGNRRTARVQQQDHQGNSNNNTRSSVYSYDGLQRLIAESKGELASNGTVPQPSQLTEWWLDNLGNWQGGANGVSIGRRTTDLDENGAAQQQQQLTHQALADNSLASVYRHIDDGSGQPAVTDTIVNDVVGNVIFDGRYYYAYDAWNRLSYVFDRGSLTASSFDANGVLLSGQSTGPWRMRLVYDAYGRLVRKQTPVVVGQDQIRQEDYRYDGVRRIHEFVTREYTLALLPANLNGNQNFGIEEPSTLETFLPFVELDLVTAYSSYWTQREYVWGPDYVDELAWIVGNGGNAQYPLLDASDTVVALTRGWTGGGLNVGDVIEQYVWSPYGECLHKETFGPTTSNTNPVGHQGLFYLRFDGLNTDAPIVPSDIIAGTGSGVWYNRNRMYDPANGRFTSKDVNSTGVPTLNSMAFHGEGISPGVEGFEGQSLYGDGMSLFAYLGINPLKRHDATGLVYDPFEDVDETIGQMWAERAAAAQQAMAFFDDMADAAIQTVVESMVIAFVPGGFYAVSLLHAAMATDDIARNGLGWANGIELMVSVAPFAAHFAGEMFSAFRSTAVELEEAGNVANRPGRIGRSLRVIQAECFVAGTPVLMESGELRPIEGLQVGDPVLSIPDPLQPAEFAVGIDPDKWRIIRLILEGKAGESKGWVELLRPITWHIDQCRLSDVSVGDHIGLCIPELGIDSFARVAVIEPCPVRLAGSAVGIVSGTVAHESSSVIALRVEGLHDPIRTTAKHPFWSISRDLWVPAGELRTGDAIASVDGSATVTNVSVAEGRTTVYNIEVMRDHTYYVSKKQILVHNSYLSVSELRATERVSTTSARYRNVRNAISKDGIIEPIKYVEYGGSKYVVDGHHRLAAARELRIDQVPAEQVWLPYGGYRTIEDLFNYFR